MAKKKEYKQVSLTRKISGLRKRANDFFDYNEAVLKKIDKLASGSWQALTEVHTQKKEIKSLLKKVIYTNECVSQALCSVLLAIKQNEYLQAWYPEHGKKLKWPNPEEVESHFENIVDDYGD